jgi:hypothetical protein
VVQEKSDWWEKAVADFEQKAAERRAGAEGESMVAEVITDASRPTVKPDPIIEKLKDVMGLLETRLQELKKHIEAAVI